MPVIAVIRSCARAQWPSGLTCLRTKQLSYPYSQDFFAFGGPLQNNSQNILILMAQRETSRSLLGLEKFFFKYVSLTCSRRGRVRIEILIAYETAEGAYEKYYVL